MAIALTAAAVNMAVALSCGALIGSERQVRQRMAGLRTNALVALGAAGFVVFSQLIEHDASPSRVAAQVVSGIGFLGAGIIFRDGFNVQGLNTAATLWCSAGVGLLAGVGAWPFALVLTGLVVFVNLGLRPLVKFLKRHTKAGVPLTRSYRVVLSCASDQEAAMRALLLRCLSLGGLHVHEIAVQTQEDGLEISALVGGEDAPDHAVEQAVQRMAAEIGVVRVRWMVADEV
ncbi:MgtC/SapB family protein [Cypionkella psychrotolerans]|uniref:MgtC/SapB family protein n=1 Tax=Cypionkella psychrotolerans TaxID=1678131 RepID=UPI0006B66DF1|nr:MgtC/SapB family protein [Cypionkella psychrotolerans]